MSFRHDGALESSGLIQSRSKATSPSGGTQGLSGPILRTLPCDYLSDTPLLHAMGFGVSQHGQFGCDTLALAFALGVRIPPIQQGHCSDTCAIPDENKAKQVRYPHLRCYLERVLRDMEYLNWAAKRGGGLER